MKKGIELDSEIINEQLLLAKYDYPFMDIKDSLSIAGVSYPSYEWSRRNNRFSQKILKKLSEAGYILPDEVLLRLYPSIE